MLVPYLRNLVGGELSKEIAIGRVAQSFKLSDKETANVVFVKRVSWTVSYLCKAELIFVGPASGATWITKKGREFLVKFPKECNRVDLANESKPFAQFIERSSNRKRKVWKLTPGGPIHPSLRQKLNERFHI